MIWTQPVGVIVLVFLWRFWLAIISGEDSAAPALIGNGQLVKDANRPLWLMIWSHWNGWCFLIWSWNFLVLWEMLDAWYYVLEAFQSCDRLTIGLTNMYYKWAIKLFGNYKKNIMIRKVCWMCYKSNGKFMIKYFIIYLKTRLSS